MIKKIMLKRWFVGIVVVITVVFFTYLLKVRDIGDTDGVVYMPYSGDATVGYSEPRSIKTVLEVSNPTDRIMEQAQILVYAPLELSASQRVTKQRVSHPHKVLVDHLGNRVLQFDFFNLPVNARFSVTLESELHTATSPNPDPGLTINPHHPGPLHESLNQTDHSSAESSFPGEGKGFAPSTGAEHFPSDPFAGEFLRERLMLEVNSPEIQKLAQSLKAGQTDESIEKILRWVNQFITEPENKYFVDGLDSTTAMVPEFMQTGFEGKFPDDMESEMTRPKGALRILKDRSGRLWDKVMLVTAMARACEIPARPAVGYRMSSNTQLGAWVEFYKEGRWWIADVQEARIQTNPSGYITVRVFDDVSSLYNRYVEGLVYSHFGVLVQSKTN